MSKTPQVFCNLTSHPIKYYACPIAQQTNRNAKTLEQKQADQKTITKNDVRLGSLKEQIGLSGQALPSMNRKQLGSKRVVGG